jgi:hypothetical protein
VSDSNHVVIRNVRTMWSSADTNPTDAVDDRGGMDPKKPSTLDVSCIEQPGVSFPQSTGTYVDANGVTRNYVPSSSNGGYAIYPVLSNDVLIDHSVRARRVGRGHLRRAVERRGDQEQRGAVQRRGLRDREHRRRRRARQRRALQHGRLPHLRPARPEPVRRRDAHLQQPLVFNNTPNFAPGGVVAGVPQGVGMLQLGYDEHEIFDNTIEWNRSVGLVYVGHELLDGNIDNPTSAWTSIPRRCTCTATRSPATARCRSRPRRA